MRPGLSIMLIPAQQYEITAVDAAASTVTIRRAIDAMTAGRIARDEAAGLRTRLAQLQARGLWARLRNKTP